MIERDSQQNVRTIHRATAYIRVYIYIYIYIYMCVCVYIFVVQSSLYWPSLLLIEASSSHSDTPHKLGCSGGLSARHRDLYLTIYNTHRRQTSIPRRD